MDQSKNHESLMLRAIELSEKNISDGGGPFGALVVKDGKIVGEGVNGVTVCNDPTAHAEVVAIRNAAKHLETFDLSGCEIYTSCEPCPMCLGAIYWARIKTIYYGNTKLDAANIGFDDAHIYSELDKPIANRNLPMVQLLHNNAQVAFKKWADSTTKTKY